MGILPVTSPNLPEKSINFAGARSNSLVPLLGGARGGLTRELRFSRGGAELVQHCQNNLSVKKVKKLTIVFSEPLVPLLGGVRGGFLLGKPRTCFQTAGGSLRSMVRSSIAFGL